MLTGTLPYKIEIAAKAGYDAIEPWIKEIDEFITRGGTLKEIKDCLDTNNIVISSVEQLVGWWELDGDLMSVADDHNAILEECKRRLAICDELDGRYLIMTPTFSHREHYATIEQGVKYYQELLSLGYKTIPTIEFMGQTGQIDTIEKCIDFINKVGNAKMVVDAYHLWRGGGKIEDFRKATKDQISVLHISDCNPLISRKHHWDRNRVMPGDGGIDLKLFIQIAKELDYDGFLNIGVYNQSLWSRNPHEVAKEGLDKMKSLG